MCWVFDWNYLKMTDFTDSLLNLIFCTDLSHHFALLYRYRKLRLVDQKINQLLHHFKMKSLFFVLSIDDYLLFLYFIVLFMNENFAFNALAKYGHWLSNFYEFVI